MPNAVTTTSFDAWTASRTALFVVDEVYQPDVFAKAGEMATAAVLSACKNAGYSAAQAVNDSLVEEVATRICVIRAMSGRGLELPEGIGNPTEDLEAIRTGQLPLNETEPDPADGQGGSSWTGPGSSGSGGRDPVMRNLRDIYR